MARSVSTYTDAALSALNAGFASKAAQKRALDDVSRAFELCRRELSDKLLADRSIGGDRWNELYYDLPSYPHLWRPAHAVDYSFAPETVALMTELAQLRDTIKAAAVNVPVKAEANPIEVKARETILELMTRRKAQYAHALELGDIFNGLPVSANVHIVHGHKGAVFLRAFYYLAGQFTPLNIIIAAAEELERRNPS